jgi:hypothetical protein
MFISSTLVFWPFGTPYGIDTEFENHDDTRFILREVTKWADGYEDVTEYYTMDLLQKGTVKVFGWGSGF